MAVSLALFEVVLAASLAAPSLVLPVGALPSDAAPDAAAEAQAKVHFKAARKLGRAKRFAEALAEADAAFQLAPRALTAEMRAWVLAEAGRPCDAFLALAGWPERTRDQAERAHVAGLLAGYASACGVGWARLTSAPSGAKVTIGGRELTTPALVGLSGGTHQVRVEAEGHVSLEASLTVVSGQPHAASWTLAPVPTVPEPEPAADPQPEPQPEPVAEVAARGPEPRDRTAGWVLTGSGVAVAAAATGLFLAAASNADTYNGLSDDDKRARQDLRDEGELMGNLAYAGWAISGAAVAVGLYMVLVPDDDEPAPVQPVASPAAGGGLLGLRGRF